MIAPVSRGELEAELNKLWCIYESVMREAHETANKIDEIQLLIEELDHED